MSRRDMAHYHPNLNEPCVHGVEPAPLDRGEWLLLFAAALVLAMVLTAFVFVLFGAFPQ